MTPKKTTVSNIAIPTTPLASLAPFWRLAEIMQMRRVQRNDRNGQYTYYECQLCSGKSLLTTGEIQHTAVCPVERMKAGK